MGSSTVRVEGRDAPEETQTADALATAPAEIRELSGSHCLSSCSGITGVGGRRSTRGTDATDIGSGAMTPRRVLVGLMSIAVLWAGAFTQERPAAAATCVSSVGPGIPAPAGLTFGADGFHAAWYGQSGYMSLCPGAEAVATVAYYNIGSRGWVSGRAGETAYLGTWNPSPGQDQPTLLGGDGTNGTPNTGWPRFNRIALQPGPYVGPGQVAWFQFRVHAPGMPGRYSLALRPLIEGTTWMEDYGVFWNLVVLNPDGTTPPVTTTIGGLGFNTASTTRADIYSETTILQNDVTRIIAEVDADIAAIEADYGRAFVGRLSFYVFSSRASAVTGIQTIAQQTPTESAYFANIGGFFSPRTGSVFLNWYVLAPWTPIVAARHELSHKMFDQIAALTSTPLPSWFDEGNARLEEFAIPGTAWDSNLERYTAASAAAMSPSPLIPLGELVSYAAWLARAAPLASFQYYEAEEAARLLRQDVGVPGTVRILDLIRAGQSFDAAFGSVTGKTTADFAAMFPGRLKASVATYPGLVTAIGTARGSGVSFVAYGFAKSTPLQVTVTLAGYNNSVSSVVTDEWGAYSGQVTAASGWPPGSYAITASDGARTASSTIVWTATTP